MHPKTRERLLATVFHQFFGLRHGEERTLRLIERLRAGKGVLEALLSPTPFSCLLTPFLIVDAQQEDCHPRIVTFCRLASLLQYALQPLEMRGSEPQERECGFLLPILVRFLAAMPGQDEVELLLVHGNP